ncbi:MAG: SocA family protein [Tannerellaceae bacterium]|jgi:uncharacterized phage-associated protein|nr:SocA family protein [Tannerellaceae bacterium]
MENESNTSCVTMTLDDFLKLKAVVLFIVNECKAIDYFRIFKILYFADKKHYADYGRRIVNDSFYALRNGPVPSALYDAIKIATGKKSKPSNSFLTLISDALSYDNDYDYIITANEQPDMDELSKSDIEYLTASIKENKDVSYIELSNKSHDSAWQEAWGKEVKLIDDLSMAKAAGANEATIEYIQEHKRIDLLLNA